MPRQPQWKSRRLAARALRVIERVKDRDPTLGAFDLVLRPTAEAFIAAYEARDIAVRNRASAVLAATAAVQALSSAVRTWARLLSSIDEGLRVSSHEILSRPSVGEDVIADAFSVLEMVEDHRERKGAYEDIVPVMRADLEARIRQAEAATQAREARHMETSDLMLETRQLAQRFVVQLSAFRAALASTVGTSSPDYQRLRPHRLGGRRRDATDEEGFDEDLDEGFDDAQVAEGGNAGQSLPARQSQRQFAEID